MTIESCRAVQVRDLSQRVFIMNAIPRQGIGAVSLVSEEMAPFSYGISYSW